MPATERSTRDRLIDAFETLLVTAGSRAATLDAVAAEAEVSKGGLLYHFHSKDELVEGMLTRLHLLLLKVFRRLPRSARRFAVHRIAPSYSVGAMCLVERSVAAMRPTLSAQPRGISRGCGSLTVPSGRYS